MAPRPDSPRIAVLLATCNGEAFLAEQLDSLASQQDVAVELFVRDDGSTDTTLAVLERYSRLWPRLRDPIRGDRLGPAGSFLELLTSVPADFDYYAFCDQDDVWAPDKLSRAASRLANGIDDQPALYCSRVRFADESLTPLGLSRLDRDVRFEHLLFENIAFGNTTVLNPAARLAVVGRLPQTGVIMHDWWCALVASAIGVVIYDEQPSVTYRQHSTNHLGGHADRFEEILGLIRAFRRDPRSFWPIHAQAAEFLRLFGERITPERRSLVCALVASQAGLFERVRYAVAGSLVRSRRLDALAGRALVLAGWC